jgi:hypothetical protein
MAKSMQSDKTTVTSISPYPDIFLEGFKITDEINMTSLVKERKGNGP